MSYSDLGGTLIGAILLWLITAAICLGPVYYDRIVEWCGC